MLSTIRDLLSSIFRWRVFFGFYLIISIGASIHDWAIPGPYKNGAQHTHYNNYVIFTNAFHHLVDEQDLYVHYPKEQNDLYKYSPFFALFMAPFAVLPDLPGLILWNLLIAGSLLYGIYLLPVLSDKQKMLIGYLLFFDIITALQNSQTNSLVAGLALLAIHTLVTNRSKLTSMLHAANFSVKIYGAFAGFVVLNRKGYMKSILYALLFAGIIIGLPFIIFPVDYASNIYMSWIDMMMNDQSVSDGRSVVGMADSWFGLDLPKTAMLLGSFLVYLPLAGRHISSENWILRVTASILIWMVIFNHKAESNTYVIAMTGVWIWYFTRHNNMVAKVLVGTAILLVSISPTFLFPSQLNTGYVQEYSLKALPCLIVWIIGLGELYRDRFFKVREGEKAIFTHELPD